MDAKDVSTEGARRIRERPRPDLNAVHEYWKSLEALGFEVQGSANLSRDAQGRVKAIFTVAVWLPNNDS